MSWTRKQVECLISLIRERPHLFDPRHSSYKSKTKRQLTMKDIAAEMSKIRPDTTVEDCKKKWHALRTNFMAERRKVADSKKSGADEDSIYLPSLYYYNDMKFIEDYVTTREKLPSLDERLELEKLYTTADFIVEDQESIMQELRTRIPMDSAPTEKEDSPQRRIIFLQPEKLYTTPDFTVEEKGSIIQELRTRIPMDGAPTEKAYSPQRRIPMDDAPTEKAYSPQRRKKQKFKKMSAHKEVILGLQRRLKEQRLQLERKRKMEEELHEMEMKIKHEELETKRFKKLYWKRKCENENIEL